MGKLTDIEIRAWIRAGERFEGRSDGDGLYLRFRPGDATPSWRFRYRIGGAQRVMNLGSYAVLSLADARKEAKRQAAMVALGSDVAGDKKQRKADAVAKIEAGRALVTVGQLADEYFGARILGRWKHPSIVRSRIDNDIKPNIGKLAIGDVKPTHIDAMLKVIVARGAPTMANDVLRWVRRMFDYAIKREMTTHNPAAAFDLADAGGKEDTRTRWLTRAELVNLFGAMRKAKGWNVQNTMTVKLLLLLAVRKGELIGARVEEFDLDAAVWHLPAERTKTSEAIDIPLSSSAITALRALIDIGNGSAWLLPARKMQARMVPHIDLNTINAALSKCVRPMMGNFEPFSPHDFRRTARTHLEALGVAPYIAERCLNHKVKGVEGIYNRHDYFEERKDALNKWAALLAEFESGNENKIVHIGKAKKRA